MSAWSKELGLLVLALAACDGSPAGTSSGSGPGRGSATGQQTSGGGVICSPLDAGCSLTQPCCAGLACDPDLELCFAPTLDAGSAGCFPSQVGGPCLTSADCLVGLACVGPDAGEKTCQAFSAFVGGYDCIGAHQLCGSSIVPCCAGDCVNGTCTGEWGSCAAVDGFTCTADSDCCTGSQLACIGGICQTKGMLYVGQHCMTDSDCLPADGYLCLSGHCNTLLDLPDGGTLPDAGPSCVSTACQAVDSGLVQCTLGSLCLQPVGFADGTPSSQLGDPCYPAGLYCASPNAARLGRCIAPAVNAACVVGGPPCQGTWASTENALACVEILSSSEQIYNYCAQPCEKAADCLDPFSTCESRGLGANETVCEWPSFIDDGGNFNFLTCDYIGGPCDIPGQDGGGTCVFLEVQGNAAIHLCYQGDPAGVAGTPCIYPATRESGGLCAAGLFCDGDFLCSTACDTTGAGPGCDAGFCVDAENGGLPGLGFCE